MGEEELPRTTIITFTFYAAAHKIYLYFPEQPFQIHLQLHPHYSNHYHTPMCTGSELCIALRIPAPRMPEQKAVDAQGPRR